MYKILKRESYDSPSLGDEERLGGQAVFLFPLSIFATFREDKYIVNNPDANFTNSLNTLKRAKKNSFIHIHLLSAVLEALP
jgi:hypothetical protein